MIPAALGVDLMAWATLLVLVSGPGLVATVLWSPVLTSSRLKSLFRSLPLTGSMVGNYVLTSMGLSMPWIVGLGWALAVFGSRANGQATGEPLITAAVWLSVAYIIGVPLVAGLGLPRIGIDWDENDYGPGTWLRLVVSSIWYAAIFAVPTFLFGIIVSIPV